MQLLKLIPVAATVALALPFLASAQPVRDAAFDARMQWWREMRFGCFVHWNASSVLGNEWRGKRGGGYAEHIQRVLKINMADYRRDAIEKFDPTGFDAEAWVALARRAGMRYFVITAKHHDGFAMYDSKVSDYNVVKASPWHHDPMRDLQAACARQGLRFGFYYSHAFDWGEPSAPGNDWEWKNPGGDLFLGGREWWLTQPEKLADVRVNYVDRKALPQIRELVTTYQPDLMWFDTPHKLPFEENLRILQSLRSLAPGVLINGRLARNSSANYGDYLSTGDRAVEFVDRTEDWEAIPTTNESYGWNPFDLSHKRPEFLIRVLAKAVARGGNLLLNIGPMADGRVDPRDVAILEGIGSWMDLHETSIRGCGRAGLPVQPWGVVTAKDRRLFLHVFDWPASALVVGGLTDSPQRAWLLADGQKTQIPTRRLNAGDLAVDLPARPTGAAHPVVVLEFATAPRGGGVRLLADNVPANQLLVFDAERHRGPKTGDATGLGYGDGKINRYYITGWTDPDQWLSWDIRLNAPTRFEVVLNYGRGTGRGEYELRCGDWKERRTVSDRAAIDKSFTELLGPLSLPAGNHRLELRALRAEGGELFRPLDLQLHPTRL
jgi:alpha-L-fucosidase